MPKWQLPRKDPVEANQVDQLIKRLDPGKRGFENSSRLDLPKMLAIPPF